MYPNNNIPPRHSHYASYSSQPPAQSYTQQYAYAPRPPEYGAYPASTAPSHHAPYPSSAPPPTDAYAAPPQGRGYTAGPSPYSAPRGGYAGESPAQGGYGRMAPPPPPRGGGYGSMPPPPRRGGGSGGGLRRAALDPYGQAGLTPASGARRPIRLSSYNEVMDLIASGRSAVVQLACGVSERTVEDMRTHGCAYGDRADASCPPPSENAARRQAAGTAMGGYNKSLSEFTSSMTVANAFMRKSGAMAIVEIDTRYLTPGSEVERGFCARPEAPLRVVSHSVLPPEQRILPSYINAD